MFTIKSISEDGEYYLVNHWNKHKAFWQQKDQCTANTTFKSIRTANASLTKLLKVMPEYAADTFTPVRVEWDQNHYCYNVTDI